MQLAQRKMGWIGVDVGTSSLKVVQVARSRQGWRVAASAVVPRQQSWQTAAAAVPAAISSLNEMKAARSLQEGYRGRSAAAMLPMALCDIHRLDGALDPERNADEVLRQAIETATQQSAEEVQCDYWSAPALPGQPGWTQALTVSRHWTDQLCLDIAQAGWSCQTIDGLPLTITRAVSMVHAPAAAAPAAALDWGHSRATLCLIDNGQPAYVRCLKDCGLRRVLDTLVENLRVSELEAQRLLEEYGLPHMESPTAAGNSAGNPGEIAELVQEIIAAPIGQIVAEIKRSFSHYRYLRRAADPECLYLLGGGAMIKHLDTQLSTRLGIETRTWRLPSGDTDPRPGSHAADCLLAPAIALSALAWEAS